MNASPRMAIFSAACAVFVAAYASALAELHPVGEGTLLAAGAYGDTLNRLSVAERHITDAVTAVNFDFRAFDTLGEEFIMFASVLGVALLLRGQPDEREGPPIDRQIGRAVPRASDAVRLLARLLAGGVVLFGIYVVSHGQVSPGGGFQGGVILATAPLLIYLAGEFQSLWRIAPRWLVESAEAIGAGGYVVIGGIAIFANTPFLFNYLPPGRAGDVFSGGTVALLDLTVGLEVAGGLIVLMLVFLEEALVRRDPA